MNTRASLIRVSDQRGTCLVERLFFSHTSTFFPASGQQAAVTGVVPFPPRFLPSIFIAHRVQQSHCSSIFHHRVLLTHALALSASQFVHKKKSQRIYARMHSAGLELTKLTYTRLEYNLMRHQGDRHTRIAALLAIRSATALNNALIRDTPLRRIYYKYDAELTTNICRRYGPQHCTYFHSCCYSPATYTGRSCYPQQPSEHAHVVTGTMCQVHTGAYLVRVTTRT